VSELKAHSAAQRLFYALDEDKNLELDQQEFEKAFDKMQEVAKTLLDVHHQQSQGR